MAEPSGPSGPSEPAKPSSSSAVPSSVEPPQSAKIDDESDPDFDDLDDVLDQFSAATVSQPKRQSPPAPSASGPGRPPASDEREPSAALPSDVTVPRGPQPTESEDEFMARLTAEMSTVMSEMSRDPALDAAAPADVAKMGKELEEFTKQMEAQGVRPEDLLKAILGEDAGSRIGEMAEQQSEPSSSASRGLEKTPGKSRDGATTKPASFEDTIRETMARMESSSAAATSATAQATQKSEEDLLAEMLKALDSESGDGDGDLSKMFLGMMEQLTNKDMLYEPMKELSTKFPDWLDENKPKLPATEYARFGRQRVIVDGIIAKFEDPTYRDDDPKCREFIWDKMQAMQAEGAPPEDLIANPFPGMGMPGMGAGEGEGALEEGCPTQ